MKVAIQIVTYNSLRYIQNCLDSLQTQTFEDFSVIVIDNGSADGSARFVRTTYPTVTVLENFKNTGFARAHNQGIDFTNAEYVLVLNPDVILTPTFLEELVAFADAHPHGASFGGKVLRLTTVLRAMRDTDQPWEVERTTTIDTTGLVVSRGRHLTDRGAGQEDTQQYDIAEQVFGIAGTSPLYRRSALHEAQVDKEYFDTLFFAYKEDVDLAWRLRLFGWQAWYVPSAVAYHHRGFYAPSGVGMRSLFRFGKTRQQRQSVSKRLRQMSLRNHHWMLVKNEQWANIFFGYTTFEGWKICGR